MATEFKQKFSFALGSLGHWFINAAFSTWVFTFYFSAVKLSIQYITTAFVLWTIWNAFNDPLIGYLSDRTYTRFGRRKPYIVFGLIPMAIIEIIIWLPPTDNMFITFLYFLLMLFGYDTFYTMISVPYDSIFPELYTSVEERAEVNTMKQILSTVGLIAAFVVPGIFIDDLTIMTGYIANGIITSIAIIIIFAISIVWGVREKPEFKSDHIHEFSFVKGMVYALKNRGFLIYTGIFFSFEYILLTLSTTVPLYAKEVLGITDPFLTSLLLGVMFIIGILTVIVWRNLDLQLGGRKAYALSLIAYGIASIPLLIVNSFETALVTVIFMGFGFGGMLYFIYLLIADVVDEDELKTGVRREGTFLGITNFFMRLSMIFSILTVSLVFTTVDWDVYIPNPGVDVILGLRLLVFLFPAIAIVISLILLYFYPFTKKYVETIKKRINVVHEEKQAKIQNI